ncbi:MAG: 23S rRNA (adenine(2503)-C(2))-methyltransferase RlmN [Candidatus Krumholzibacteriota bacterium]
MDCKPLLRSLVPDRLAGLVAEAGLPAYRADQLADWLFARGVFRWEEMTNLPQALRADLAARFDLSALEPTERQVSGDGTRKFLFRLRDGATVESVIIPMEEHATFCISTQVGCAMACRFCATARGGLVRNLEAGEILEQVLRLRHDTAADPLPGLGNRQFNVVYMGMGEPLDNWEAVNDSLTCMMDPGGLAMSRRRIQISTSGPGEGLRKMVAAEPGVGLTISLGGSTDAERKAVMPVPGRTSIREVLDLAVQYVRRTGRRATVAWVLIAGQTDDPEQAARLARLLRGKPLKVNLIPLNPLDDGKLLPPDQKEIQAFRRILADAGIDTFVRISGGQDIAAACGQLRRRRLRS